MTEEASSVSGSWYGNYYYASGNSAYGFEAVFVQSGSAVSGNILDLGRLGEATVTGTFVCPNLEFTKNYYKGTHSTVVYRGTMSLDGKMLSGTWEIAPLSRGTWTAWRLEEKEELDELDTELEKQKEKERPLVEVAPISR